MKKIFCWFILIAFLAGCNGFIRESLSVPIEGGVSRKQVVGEAFKLFAKLNFSCNNDNKKIVVCNYSHSGSISSREISIKIVDDAGSPYVYFHLEHSSVDLIPSYYWELLNGQVNALKELSEIFKKRGIKNVYTPSSVREEN